MVTDISMAQAAERQDLEVLLHEKQYKGKNCHLTCPSFMLFSVWNLTKATQHVTDHTCRVMISMSTQIELPCYFCYSNMCNDMTPAIQQSQQEIPILLLVFSHEKLHSVNF